MNYLNIDVALEIREQTAESEAQFEIYNEDGNIIGRRSDTEFEQHCAEMKEKRLFIVKAVCEGKEVAFKSIVVPNKPEERFASLSHVLHTLSASLVKNFSRPVEVEQEKGLVIVP